MKATVMLILQKKCRSGVSRDALALPLEIRRKKLRGSRRSYIFYSKSIAAGRRSHKSRPYISREASPPWRIAT
jgi:hypothetical protein